MVLDESPTAYEAAVQEPQRLMTAQENKKHGFMKNSCVCIQNKRLSLDAKLTLTNSGRLLLIKSTCILYEQRSTK